MTLRDLTTRVRRLEELSRGLAKEVVFWKECDDPLLYRERRAYLGAIQDALAGVNHEKGEIYLPFVDVSSAPFALTRNNAGVSDRRAQRTSSCPRLSM
jgi:hypothetical protein